jgi:hypothetical protein
MLKIDLPNDIAARAIAHMGPPASARSYKGFTDAEMRQAAAELAAFLGKYRRVLSMSAVSRNAGKPTIWAYSVEKAAGEGSISPDRAQLFIDAATEYLKQAYGDGGAV